MGFPGKARWLAIGAVMLLLTIGGGSLLGTIILIDKRGDIASVAVVGKGGTSQRLSRLPGAFVGIARFEGELAISCQNGKEYRGGYITPHMNEWSAIRAGAVCGAKRPT